MIHDLKITEDFADAILSGDKPFEVRENDRGFQKGDIITFEVVERSGYRMPLFDHALNGKSYEITYVLSGWGLKEGFVALGIRERGSDHEA